MSCHPKVKLKSMCKYLHVHDFVHVSYNVHDNFKNSLSGEDVYSVLVCWCVCECNLKERGLMTPSLLLPWLNLHLAQSLHRVDKKPTRD